MAAKPRGEGRTYRPRMTDTVSRGLEILLDPDGHNAPQGLPLHELHEWIAAKRAARKWVAEQVRWWNRKRREKVGRA